MPRTVSMMVGELIDASLRRILHMKESTVFSLTIAPSGHAAATTALCRATSPDRDVIAASVRYSVGVRGTSPPSHRRCDRWG